MSDRLGVSTEDRNLRNRHRSGFVLLTGLPGAGKTTLARNVERRLFSHDIQVFILDGDDIRAGLNRDLGFLMRDRQENQRRIVEVGKLFVSAGMVVVVSSIAPQAQNRAEMRQAISPSYFMEVYVKCPQSICEERDPKGLYAKARQGTVQNFTGICNHYEEPICADMVVQTDRASVDECSFQITTRILDAVALKH